MAASLASSGGVTVLTLTSDPSSACPPLCQLLGALCCTPALCSRARRLPVPRHGPQAALGALWAAAGLLQLGLGAVLLATEDAVSHQLTETHCPVWLGLLFVAVGVSSVLTERSPAPCVLLLSAVLNLFGAAMSITAIVWYSTQLYQAGYWSMCQDDYSDYSWLRPSVTPPPGEDFLQERCQEAWRVLRALVSGASAVLVGVAVLGLGLGVASASLGFRALGRGGAREEGPRGGVEQEVSGRYR